MFWITAIDHQLTSLSVHWGRFCCYHKLPPFTVSIIQFKYYSNFNAVFLKTNIYGIDFIYTCLVEIGENFHRLMVLIISLEAQFWRDHGYNCSWNVWFISFHSHLTNCIVWTGSYNILVYLITSNRHKCIKL